MKFVSVFSIKGGEGKTTLTILCADYLSVRKGKRVLAVDLDAQGSLSDHYQPDRRDSWNGRSLRTICAELTGTELVQELSRLIVHSAGNIRGHTDGIDLLPTASYDFSELRDGEMTYADRIRSAQAFKTAISEMAYDYVLFDMPPAQPFSVMPYLGVSDHILIPVVPIELSRRCLPFTLEAIDKSHDASAANTRRPDTVVIFSKIRPPNSYQEMMRVIETYLRTESRVPDVRVTRDGLHDGIMVKDALEFRAPPDMYRAYSTKYLFAGGVVSTTVERALFPDRGTIG